MKEERHHIPPQGKEKLSFSWHALSTEEVLKELDTGLHSRPDEQRSRPAPGAIRPKPAG